MIIPSHSIQSSSLIITQVFYSLYYEDRAHVKCLLSRSDGDSNRFLTSWWVIPHTNHTHWSTELQITIFHYPEQIRGFDRHRPYPRTVPTTEVSKVYQGCALRPRRSPQPAPIQPYIGPIPDQNSVQTSRSERLILPAKCGACVQHDKRVVNDQSLIDTGRGTTVNTTIRPCPVSVSFPHLVTFYYSINS